jgi:hypothetical protein
MSLQDDYGISILLKKNIREEDIKSIKNEFFRKKFLKIYLKYGESEFKKRVNRFLLTFLRTSKKSIINSYRYFYFYFHYINPKKSILLDFIKKNYLSLSFKEIKKLKLKLSDVRKKGITVQKSYKYFKIKIPSLKKFLILNFLSSYKWYFKYLTESYYKQFIKQSNLDLIKNSNSINFHKIKLNFRFNQIISDDFYYNKPDKDFFGSFKNKITLNTKKNDFILNSKRNHPSNTIKNIIDISGFTPNIIKSLYFDNVSKIKPYLKALLKFNPHKFKVLMKERIYKNMKINQLQNFKIKKRLKIKNIKKRLKIKNIKMKHTQSIYLANLISGRNLNQIKIKYLNKHLLKTVNHFDLPLHKLSKTQQNILRASQPLY